ncbi:MAG: nitronate monooxygenase family protein, partial [Hydrococcus sp. Prado102]|nr:nitronate monooxygenase family protein [Hydrococcus sp. Prado102]
GLKSPYLDLNNKKRRFFEANRLALIDELQKARQISPKGIIGVNILVATKDYPELAQTAAAHGANLIVTGAGIPLNLPEYTKNYPDVALVPIVANLESAQIVCETWQQQYRRLPDAFIVENCKAIGGHFASQCEENNVSTIETAIAQLQDYLKNIKANIPVIVTGGIWDRTDIDRTLALGANGVQIGTRFITTKECGGDRRYKEFYLQAESKNLVTLPSPAGKPVRAMGNIFTQKVLANSLTLEKRCIANCLESCLCRDKGKTYCLLQALSLAAQGDVEGGLIFSGGAIKPVEEILSVAELMAVLT